MAREREGMIHDGESYFPDSVVIFTEMKNAPLRHFFSYLREKEFVFQRDVSRYVDKCQAQVIAKAKLEEVESMLIYMAEHLRVADSEPREAKPRRSRGRPRGFGRRTYSDSRQGRLF